MIPKSESNTSQKPHLFKTISGAVNDKINTAKTLIFGSSDEKAQIIQDTMGHIPFGLGEFIKEAKFIENHNDRIPHIAFDLFATFAIGTSAPLILLTLSPSLLPLLGAGTTALVVGSSGYLARGSYLTGRAVFNSVLYNDKLSLSIWPAIGGFIPGLGNISPLFVSMVGAFTDKEYSNLLQFVKQKALKTKQQFSDIIAPEPYFSKEGKGLPLHLLENIMHYSQR